MRSIMKMLVEGFFDEFNQLKNPRMEKNKPYPMNEWIFTENSLHWVLDMSFSEDQP